ncbi:hypothetical protein QLS71_016880 [Mariniflexile litorale]|uniref:Uncharacterized protein n=1 Tax=Mariniflexile litorale TaxID=3045158 RepID=A0AAU7EEW4_9FLAO|nr:hypothetical protein [Mariniflexile sp. KMM 9835]MDQ8211519.1 hypothetical protein [Mariniflexile sp. KMM 9835]
MAKLKSLIKIEGTLDGMTFYKGKEGYLVRTKGGVSKNRIETDPAFIRTRENGQEFSQISKSGKLLRLVLTPLISDVKDDTLIARLVKVMGQVKNADSTSTRGNRQVGIGLETLEGKNMLKGFDFNANAGLNEILLTDYLLNTATGEINIPNFIPLQQLNTPSGATHVSILSAVININFITNEKTLQASAEINVPINNTSVAINATPPSMPNGTGQTVFLFKISFYQEINGLQYALNNGSFNVLQIIEII